MKKNSINSVSIENIFSLALMRFKGSFWFLVLSQLVLAVTMLVIAAITALGAIALIGIDTLKEIFSTMVILSSVEDPALVEALTFPEVSAFSIVGLVVLGVIAFAVFSYVFLGLTKMYINVARDGSARIKDIFGSSVSQLVSYIVATVLLIVLVGILFTVAGVFGVINPILGLVAFFVAFVLLIVITIRLAIYTQLIADGTVDGAVDALRSSAAAIKNKFWIVLAAIVLIGIVSFALSFVFALIPIIGQVVHFFFVAPFVTLLAATLYLEIVEKEMAFEETVTDQVDEVREGDIA